MCARGALCKLYEVLTLARRMPLRRFLGLNLVRDLLLGSHCVPSVVEGLSFLELIVALEIRMVVRRNKFTISAHPLPQLPIQSRTN